MYSAFAACGYSSHKSSRAVGGRGREVGGPCPPGCSPSKLSWNQAKSYCHLYGAQATANDRRTASPLT
ncbi:hypothetical protein TNCV_425651 [Trichonephila clavipes]|nr:hypothetical protein TNCV_425651 [Trichonephila clavipes]